VNHGIAFVIAKYIFFGGIVVLNYLSAINEHTLRQGSSIHIRFRYKFRASIPRTLFKIFMPCRYVPHVPHDRLLSNLSLTFEDVDVVLPT
jgi:hypothetical protein